MNLRKRSVPQDQFLDLIIYLVLLTTKYDFNSQFHLQTGKVVIGGPEPSTTRNP